MKQKDRIKLSDLEAFLSKPYLYASNGHYRMYVSYNTYEILDVRKPPDPAFPPLLTTTDMKKAVEFWNELN